MKLFSQQPMNPQELVHTQSSGPQSHLEDSEQLPLDTFYHSESFHDGVKNLAEHCPISAKKLLEMCQGNEQLMKTYDDLVKQAIRYVETILELQDEISHPDRYDKELIMTRDRARGFAHTAFIDVTNKMSRELAGAGKDNKFFASVIIKLPNGSYSRPQYTLFAMQFAMSYYLSRHPELTDSI